MKPIKSPGQVVKSQERNEDERARALAQRIVQTIEEGEDLMAGRNLFLDVKETDEDKPIAPRMIAEAEDVLGHAGWIDVRIAHIEDEGKFIVMLTVPRALSLG